MDSDPKDNWYEKIAKSGWIGDKAKVAAESGRAPWSSDQAKPKSKFGDAYGAALQSLRMKSKDKSDDGC